MTLVTTSRRSTPESRAVARDLAFALGARYLARGKHGLRELTETDTSFFILSQEEKGLMLRWYHEGEPAIERKILKLESKRREGPITRGIITSDRDLHHCLTGSYPVIADERDDAIIMVDGPQRRQTLLKMEKKGTKKPI